MESAIANYQPTYIVVMVSGGLDSALAYALADEMGLPIDLILHGNTRTGIPQTTQFVTDYYGSLRPDFAVADAGDAYEVTSHARASSAKGECSQLCLSHFESRSLSGRDLPADTAGQARRACHAVEWSAGIRKRQPAPQPARRSDGQGQYVSGKHLPLLERRRPRIAYLTRQVETCRSMQPKAPAPNIGKCMTQSRPKSNGRRVINLHIRYH